MRASRPEKESRIDLEGGVRDEPTRAHLLRAVERYKEALALLKTADTSGKAMTSAGGREALDVFAQRADEIDCVILDLTMPHMDGEQAYRELKRIDPEACVIMSSGYNEQEVTQRFVGKGLAGFIQKPYELDKLIATLRQTLEA